MYNAAVILRYQRQRQIIESMKQIISGQHVSGYWKESSDEMLSDFFVDRNMIDQAVLDEIPAYLPEDKNTIYRTLVAIYILREEFEDRKMEWALIGKKGKKWLKDLGLKRVHLLLLKFTLKFANDTSLGEGIRAYVEGFDKKDLTESQREELAFVFAAVIQYE